MFAQQGHRLRVERDPPHLVRLRALLDADTAVEDVVPADLDRLGVEVDVPPPKGAHLTAPHACCHHQPHERAPVVIERERRVEQARGSAGDGGSGSGVFARGRCATRAGFDEIHSHRTAADSVPLMIEWICRTVDAAIGLQACGRHLDPAVVLAVGAVLLDGRPAVAARPASAQLAVKRLQRPRGEPVDRRPRRARAGSSARCTRRTCAASCPPARPCAATRRGVRERHGRVGRALRVTSA